MINLADEKGHQTMAFFGIAFRSYEKTSSCDQEDSANGKVRLHYG